VEILILSARPDTASNGRLMAAAADAGVDCRIVNATELVATTTRSIHNGSGALTDPIPRAVFARVGNWRPDSVLSLLEVLVARGVPTPNPAPAIRIGRDHWRTALVLSAKGLPVPLTLAGADPESLAATAAQRLRFPVVVKQRRSRMGVGVIRCSSLDHLEAVLDSLWRLGDEIVVQQYHDTGGESLRLLVVGGEVVSAASFRAAEGEWRSNAARGGAVTDWQGEAETSGLAVAATRAVGLDVCGVDLLPTASGMLIGEVNPTPGFVNLERATGIDVAGAIIAHLVELGG
jgi:RimK family alpha-L-glutamate ligase